MGLDPNQLAMVPIAGMVDLADGGKVVSCQVDSTSSQSGGIKPGQPVKLVDSAGGVPKVVELAAADDIVFGFVPYNIKDSSYAPLAAVEVVTGYGAVMYMTAGGAISRGALVRPGAATTGKVVNNAALSGLHICGWAFDKAAADGDLIRVYIDAPGYFKA